MTAFLLCRSPRIPAIFDLEEQKFQPKNHQLATYCLYRTFSVNKFSDFCSGKFCPDSILFNLKTFPELKDL